LKILEEAQERFMENQQEIESYLQEDRKKWYDLCRRLKEQKERQQQQELAEKKKKKKQQQQQLQPQGNEENSSTIYLPPQPRKIQSLILHRPTIQPQDAPQFRQASVGNSAAAGARRCTMLQRASSQRFCTRMEALQPLRQASMQQMHSKRHTSMRPFMDRNATYQYDSATTVTDQDDNKNSVNNASTAIEESSLVHLMERESLLYDRRQLPRRLSCPRKLGHELNVLRSMFLAAWE
jgi:hypothetical protein